MHFVAALDKVPRIRCVLGLHESSATGAADGYARMTDRPAATLLHCGPGLSNGLSQLHNARRARSPVVNIVGDQATYHRPFDAPLTTDTEGWARPVSLWTRTCMHAEAVGADAAAAVQAARSDSGVATLILPSDVCWNPGGKVAAALPVIAKPLVSPAAVDNAARVLRSKQTTLIVLGGLALREASLADAHRIAAASGARLITTQAVARIERGGNRCFVDRIPYSGDQARELLQGIRNVILIGAPVPAISFGYPGKSSRPFPEDAVVHTLARPEQDPCDALARLVDAMGARAAQLPKSKRGSISVGSITGAVTSRAVAQALTALLPEQAIVADESVSFGRSIFGGTVDAAPHDWLTLTGGAIGSALPLALGAAVAAPSRRVIALEGDGSGMYTVQALWTMAREKLDVTVVMLANRKYAILQGELANVGAKAGKTALDMLDISNPTIDWVGLANSMGVEAARAVDMETFTDLFGAANRRNGPFLIELVL